MMDPSLLVVGITAPLGLVSQTIKTTNVYVDTAEHAEQDATEVLQELDTLGSSSSS